MPMEEGVSLYHAIEILTRGIHRVPVVAEEGGPIVNIVSQSSVVRFLAQHEEFISSLEARSFTWKTLKVSHDKPFAVTKADTAVTAFRILSEHQADALAIVDKHGAFRASLSISDLRVRERLWRHAASLFFNLDCRASPTTSSSGFSCRSSNL